MKKLIVILLLFFAVASVYAQEQTQTYLWPIEGAEAGTNMISVPQSYIENELNFSNLFIGAPEGTTVLSPVDGVITFISVGYSNSLTYSTSMRYEGTFDERLEKVKADPPASMEIKFINGHLGIKAHDGNMVHLSGLSGGLPLKTGQTLKRGEPIGRVGYSYHKIKEPCIEIAVERNSRVSDPMSPFGIESTFIPPAEIKPVEYLTKEQAKEDFMIYINSLKEAYPGLYDVVTENELEDYIAETIAYIDSSDGDISFDRFMNKIIYGTISKIHDSHIYFKGFPWKREMQCPTGYAALHFGWIGDTLVCTNAIKEYEHLIGKEAVSINGMSADSMKNILITEPVGYDAKVESVKEYYLATFGYTGDGKNMNVDVEFADEGKMYFPEISDSREFVYNYRDFVNTNRHKEGYTTTILNDSTAYIGLTTFSLNQVQVEEIGAFIDSVSNKPNLIIDVRNNGGGEGWVIDKLYSYIAGEPFTVDSHSKVNKQSGYECFKYSLNRVPEDDTFSNYVEEPGREGYYQRSEDVSAIGVADSVINYKGRVYVLINELSASAATLFPAMLIRSHRGVTVGRETRTAYHFMNAVRFVDLRLPNSLATITIPLVKCVFDTVVNERVPYGRGVLPDYYVPITIEEMSYENGDAILNYTLNLIENGEYIQNENPFAIPEITKSGSGNSLIWSIIGLCILTAIFCFLFIPSKTKNPTKS